jgi:hypothetical protein
MIKWRIKKLIGSFYKRRANFLKHNYFKATAKAKQPNRSITYCIMTMMPVQTRRDFSLTTLYMHTTTSASSQGIRFWGIFCFVLFFYGTGVWIQGFRLASRCSTTWAHFALVILMIGFPKLFARAELWSAWPQASQVARITVMSHWHLAPQLFFALFIFQVESQVFAQGQP